VRAALYLFMHPRRTPIHLQDAFRPLHTQSLARTNDPRMRARHHHTLTPPPAVHAPPTRIGNTNTPVALISFQPIDALHSDLSANQKRVCGVAVTQRWYYFVHSQGWARLWKRAPHPRRTGPASSPTRITCSPLSASPSRMY